MSGKYFLEIQFGQIPDKWARHPEPFATREEAEQVGRDYVAKHQPDKRLDEEAYRLTH
jgi:hypothetical protein